MKDYRDNYRGMFNDPRLVAHDRYNISHPGLNCHEFEVTETGCSGCPRPELTAADFDIDDCTLDPSHQHHSHDDQPMWRSDAERDAGMSANDQGLDGTPFLSYYDKIHALSFVWDGTQGNWIDVSFGGYGEPVIARIPNPTIPSVTYPPEMLMSIFGKTCDSFINLIHLMEDVDPKECREGKS